jgi:hypothetical protein
MLTRVKKKHALGALCANLKLIFSKAKKNFNSLIPPLQFLLGFQSVRTL